MQFDCTPSAAAEETAAAAVSKLTSLLIYKYNLLMNYLTDPCGDRTVKDVPTPVQPRVPLPDADLYPSPSPASNNRNRLNTPIEKKKEEGSTATVSVPDWKFVRDFQQREGKLTKA